jgi:ribonuclease D
MEINKESEEKENLNKAFEEMTLKEDNYLKLEDFGYKYEDIKEIKNLEELDEMIKTLKKEKIIGLDCEWKNNKGMIDLMQIATQKEIFLVRFVLFVKKRTEWKNSDDKKKRFLNNLIKSLMKDIFHNHEIIKVSFDFKYDAIYLKNTFSHLKELYFYKNMYDIRYFDFKNKYGKIYGLDLTCWNFLKKRLDKAHQVSSWNNNELKKEQIVYAALDAVVVRELYKILIFQYPLVEPCLFSYSKDNVDFCLKNKIKSMKL